MSDESLDPEVVCKKLNEALALAYRSALGYTVAGGGLQGMQYQGLAVQLVEWAFEELRDAHTIVEKIIGLGGEPTTTAATFAYQADPDEAVRGLIEREREGVAALHAVIPDTGQEPRSEALEHMLEHQIMRKQHHLDALRRSVGDVG